MLANLLCDLPDTFCWWCAKNTTPSGRNVCRNAYIQTAFLQSEFARVPAYNEWHVCYIMYTLVSTLSRQRKEGFARAYLYYWLWTLFKSNSCRIFMKLSTQFLDFIFQNAAYAWGSTSNLCYLTNELKDAFKIKSVTIKLHLCLKKKSVYCSLINFSASISRS